MASFVILTTQRSGSTWFGHTLNTHPAIRCAEELFFDNREQLRATNASHTCYEYRYSHATRFLDDLYAGRVTKSSGDGASCATGPHNRWGPCEPGLACGFKLMYNQATAQHYEYLRAKGIAVLHLLRRNKLDVVVSRLVAQATGVWKPSGVPASDSATRASLAFLQPSELVSRVGRLLSDEAKANVTLREHRIAPLVVIYEELTQPPRDAWDAVLRRLGVIGTRRAQLPPSERARRLPPGAPQPQPQPQPQGLRFDTSTKRVEAPARYLRPELRAALATRGWDWMWPRGPVGQMNASSGRSGK